MFGFELRKTNGSFPFGMPSSLETHPCFSQFLLHTDVIQTSQFHRANKKQAVALALSLDWVVHRVISLHIYDKFSTSFRCSLDFNQTEHLQTSDLSGCNFNGLWYPSSPLHQVPFLFLDVDELDFLVKLAKLVESRPFYFGGGFSLANYIKTVLDGVSAAQFAKIMVIQIRTFA